jgi:pentose-5-phosphate-3-epimerase
MHHNHTENGNKGEMGSEHNSGSNEQPSKYRKIVPAVMADSYDDLEEKIARVKGLVERVQIDIMDGRFVDAMSWPYRKLAGMHGNAATHHADDDISGTATEKPENLDRNFIEIMKEVKGMPCWEDFDFEIDLMVANPAKAVEQWSSAGATRVILHLRENNTSDISAAIDIAANRGIEVSIAILPLSLSAIVHDFIFSKKTAHISGIQCMGIDRVGHQRQSFDPHVIELLKELRTEIDSLGDERSMTLSVDGGVSFETAGDLFDAGADYLVAGSAVYDADSVIQALDRFADISGE